MVNVKLTSVNGQAVSDEEKYFYDVAGPVTLGFTYTKDGQTLTAECEIEVIGIESISYENISDEKGSEIAFRTEYNVGESFDSNGMKVTVIYEDGAVAIFQNNIETAAGADEQKPADKGFEQVTDAADVKNLLKVTLSTEITFSPEKLEILGEQIVTGDYFDEPFDINVTVKIADGMYGIVYMAADRTTQLAVQVGTENDYEAIFNYVWGTPGFVGWEVEDYGVVYLAGTAVKFGENTAMWGDDKVLYLYATFGGQSIPSKVSEDIVVSIHYDTNNRVVVSITAVDGGYIPEGYLRVTGNYVVQELDPVLGILVNTTKSFDMTVKIDQGTTCYVFNTDNCGFYLGMISISANYTDLEGNFDVTSNPESYAYVPAEEGA